MYQNQGDWLSHLELPTKECTRQMTSLVVSTKHLIKNNVSSPILLKEKREHFAAHSEASITPRPESEKDITRKWQTNILTNVYAKILVHQIPQHTEGLYPMTKWDLSEGCKLGLAHENQSTDTEKASDKIPYTLMIKIFNKLGTGGAASTWCKTCMKTHGSHHTWYRKDWAMLPLRSVPWQECPISPLLFIIVPDVLATIIGQ